MKIRNSILLMILLSVSAIFAQGVEGNVNVHGFMGQSFILSQGNDFMVANSKNGSHELNEVGLTITSQITPKFRVGFQLLSRDFGDQDNNKTQLDWAFADYRFKDYLGVRFGKVKLPYGLYNEGRDTDILRPMVFLPQSIYDEQYRPYLLAYQGTGFYGNFSNDLIGSFDYHIYTGSMNLNKDEIVMKVTNTVANSVINAGLKSNLYKTVYDMSIAQGATAEQAAAQAGATLNASTFDFQYLYTDARCKSLFGGSLFWNTPLSGLKTGFSYMTVDLDFFSPTATATINTPLPAPYASITKDFKKKRDGGIPQRMGFSGEWQYNALTIAAEYNLTTLQHNTYDEDNGSNTSEFERDEIGYYAMISWMLNDKLTLSLLYDYLSIDRQEVTASGITTDLLKGTEDWLNERTDIAIGGRYDINYHWTIKAEYHLMSGYAKVYSEYLDPIENTPADAEENWSYGLLKASYNF